MKLLSNRLSSSSVVMFLHHFSAVAFINQVNKETVYVFLASLKLILNSGRTRSLTFQPTAIKYAL